jgi:hypothetical protein
MEEKIYNMKNGRFSFREMEVIAVEFAINCLNGYNGSFSDYMNSVNKNWRKNLKRIDKQETNIKDFHRMTTTPNFFRKLNISESNNIDNDCNCGQPSCTFGCS